MGLFRKLFSFSKKEIDHIFSHAVLLKKQHGFKLLQLPITKLPSDIQQTIPQGKLLIITPRFSGKAHERNLIRRRAKEIFYQEQLFKKPVISVLIAAPTAIHTSFDDLKKFLVGNI